ncbi:MAG TPA: CsgG/HfaB family protein, partial [Candidatus Competibacteraceae bacterium]|nr:CsgG/HfaB family protein [Candidatus Competibacteraceae bacterium]
MMGQILLRSLLYPLLFLLAVPLPWPVQAASAPAAPRMTATVVEFSVRGDLPEQTGAILADLMVAAIANTGRFTLKDRLSLLAVAKIAKAQELGSTGLLDPKTAAELGRRYEVDAVVIGEVSKLGNLINVTARLIDTRNASLLRSGQIQGKNLDAIQIEVNQLASMIIAPPEPPRTFALTVRTEPADARVRLLNVPLTYQPGMQLSPGEYQVEVTHPGYVTHTGPVRIEDRDATLNVALRKALYALTIEPQPVDAQVRLAGNAPPYRPGVALEPGEYPVEVSREGYVTRRFPVRVVDGEVRVPVVLEKQPPVASAPPGGYRLNVYTHPEKATVRLLDSKLAYQAGGRLPPGEYRIEVALDGYESSTLAVRIIDSDVTVPVTLKPVERPTVYRLTVQARPANAQVRLVDSESTYQPGVRLAPGRYTVEVAATGYATATVPVRIVDSDVTLPVTLNREEAVAAPPPPPTQYRLTVRADPANAQVRLLGTRTRYQA